MLIHIQVNKTLFLKQEITMIKNTLFQLQNQNLNNNHIAKPNLDILLLR